MVLMDDCPLIVNLAQANRQTEIQLDIFSAGFLFGALHGSDYKCHIAAGHDVHFLNIKNHRRMSTRKDKSQVLRYALIPFD